jgi:DNA gyrase subunit B
LDENVTDIDALLRLLSRDTGDDDPFSCELVRETETELVVRTIERRTGLATTHHVRRSALEANEYQRLAAVHHDIVELVGAPTFQVRLADNTTEAHSFTELRDAVLGVAQKGVQYYRFKGLGEMDPDELRETTMDPASRTLVRVTMEDAASADLVFSMLMGDQVEPRRAFIEDNARLVTNLDV